ncbi:hypothetical protein F25303_26 [Fusarium sp. NRRL 25303]|nr:hypothetical protein F25303_26 [Fusarium sp. NRRL 25303]
MDGKVEGESESRATGAREQTGSGQRTGQHCSRLAATFSAGNPASDAANSGEKGDGGAEPASEGEFFSLGGSPSAVRSSSTRTMGCRGGGAREDKDAQHTETKPSAGDFD